MASASITTRKTNSGGRRYVVRFRRGGRYFPIEHGGSFPTMREARIRRDLIAGELAAGRDPREALRRLTEAPTTRTFAQTFEAFIESRVDVAEATLANYRTHRDRLVVTLIGAKDPLAAFLAGRPGGRDGALSGPLPRFGSDLRRDASAGARLCGRRAEPGNGQAGEAAEDRARRFLIRLPSRRSPRSSGTLPRSGVWLSASSSRQGCGPGSSRSSNGRTSTRPTPASASAAARRPRRDDGLPFLNGSCSSSGLHAHPTIAPLSGECSPERPGRFSGWRCGEDAKPPASLSTPRTTSAIATHR